MRPENAFCEISSLALANMSKLFQIMHAKIMHAKLPMVKGHSISGVSHHDPRT